MTNTPKLTKSPILPQISVHYYERYLPTAFDESLSILQKINKVIYHLNQIGLNNNALSTQWNELMEWILGDGLSNIVSDEIDQRIADGTFDELIYRIVGDLTKLTTENKESLVNAVNEINTLLTELRIDVGNVENLNTTNKILVDAINEIKATNDINNDAVTSIGEASGYGIISGFKVRQQNVLAMAVEVGDYNTPNIIHMPNGVRYVVPSQAVAIDSSSQTLNRLDIIYVDVDGVVKYQAGQFAQTPVPPTPPNGSVLLAEITVNANDTTTNDIDIKDKREIKNLNHLLTDNKANLVQAINELFRNLVSLNNDLSDTYTELTSQINELDTTINNRINQLETDIDENVTAEINIINQKILDLTNDINETINGEITTLTNRLNEFETETDELISILNTNLEQLRTDYDNTKNRLLVSDTQPTTQLESDVWVKTSDETPQNKKAVIQEKTESGYKTLYPETLVEQVIDLIRNKNLTELLFEKVDKGDIFVSAKEFGAKGDGVTDDSVALQAWLDNPNPYKILTNGTYIVSQPLVLSLTNTTIKTDGAKIVAKVPTHVDFTVLTVNADNCKISLDIDGQSKTSIAIKVNGAGCTVKGCTLKNFKGLVANGVGVYAQTTGGIIIEDNYIENIDAVDNDIFGDETGASRAILLYNTQPATKTSIIRNNTVKTIVGEEGDAIQVLFFDGTNYPFMSAKAIIQNNIIIDCNRRAVKVQGSDVMVIGNVHQSTLTLAQTPKASSLINAIQSNNVIIRDNVLDGRFIAGISLSGSATNKMKNTVVKDNIIYSGFVEQSGTRNRTNAIYYDHMERLDILGNVIYDGIQSISGQNSKFVNILSNVMYGGSDSATQTNINSTANNDYVTIKENVAMDGQRLYMIQNQAPNSIIENNHCRHTGSVLRTFATAVNSVHRNNTNMSDKQATIGDFENQVHADSRNMGVGGSPIPSVMFTSVAPNIEQPNIQHSKGDISYKRDATATGTIGWQCTGSGKPGIWREF